LSQSFGDLTPVKKVITTISVRRPNPQDFVRVHSSPEYQADVATLTLKEHREVYLVDPSLLPAMPGDIQPRRLVTAISRQGVLFVWPLRLPSEDGRADNWLVSDLEAASLGKSSWIRVQPNMAGGFYNVLSCTAAIPEPDWPELSFNDILPIGFRGKYIKDLDHPVLRRLRGEL
jgi:hypothetical protein